MNQWEIYLYPFREEQPHPAVILSNEERCYNPQLLNVNALICTSVRLNRGPKRSEVVLDEADGLDWKTAVRCDVIHFLPMAAFGARRGIVIQPRRIQITRMLFESLRLPLA